MKRVLFFFVCLCPGFFTPGYLFAQDLTLTQNISANAQLALSNPNYRVTPGDIYTLVYLAGTQIIKYTITVDTTYRIRVANLGTIDGSGKTFSQVKTQVEAVVANNYPLSGVQLFLSQPAVFMVYIKGEVKAATEINAWGLNRLSSILKDNTTNFSSLRDVQVQSSGGLTKVYDLFKASRFGDLTQDPYLRPGDIITLGRVSRTVTITGAVERPGAYQLLEGEELKELIEIYGNGFTPTADKTRLELVRMVNSVSVSGDKIFLAEEDVAVNYSLQDYDAITVPEITKLQPVMFVEGAVSPSGSAGTNAANAGASPTVSTRLVVPFNRGENYASLIRRNGHWFSAVSDTKNAYLIRGEEHIPVNLNPILYDAEYHSELIIEENDVLIIPFRQYFVTVAGAVVAPGRYPYIPDRGWDYYIALAGGFVPGRNSMQSVTITDVAGKKQNKSVPIAPETVITADTNAFLFYFNQYAPVVMTTLSLVTTSLSIYVSARNAR
ncbi:MAG: SLBB domain-containing protein [Treponema sp.]|jgi:protein involved in polysaccharide export with SLBB domain|nr:SLBB domain-containing protein [Treponema sp.]